MKNINYIRGVSRTARTAIFAALCAVSAAVPAIASPSCDRVFPIALMQSAYPGKTTSTSPNQPAAGALIMNCAHRVSGSGTISLKLFDASMESPYSTTVKQLGMEGYKCSPIDTIVGFPASSCALATGSSTINSIVFTTTNGKYAAILTAFITQYAAIPTGGSPPTPLYTIAKAVNSNISAGR